MLYAYIPSNKFMRLERKTENYLIVSIEKGKTKSMTSHLWYHKKNLFNIYLSIRFRQVKSMPQIVLEF
ncbi:hypothetical protein AQUCO_02300175v1 [Aquilegia coerulea]|uniref:Uncharacterized protein n=1 Tax=Aquilegia coerulea TaxID=218851 RepID=A0A2G5DCI9_AQUCA|nr:hypothetical protein AQUCO_02300175v1 [Aquilegia coerulea]